MIEKVISGGQTGADRGGLDAALEFEIPHGGWCPKGRIAEDGVIPPVYQLSETKSTAYPPRTKLNISSSDGTLIVTRGKYGRGTRLTISLCEEMSKPRVHIKFDKIDLDAAVQQVVAWVKTNNIKVLNVAGSRESSTPGLQEQTKYFVMLVLNELNEETESII